MPRPVLPITIEGLPAAPQRCLVDSGAVHNLFGAWIAEAAGIPLEDAPEQRIAVGGTTTHARVARVGLAVGSHEWEAPVWFCDPWRPRFQLLGQEGFLRYFRVTISAAEEWLELAPERGD